MLTTIQTRMSSNWWFVSHKASVLAFTLNMSFLFSFLFCLPCFTLTVTQAPGVGEMLVVKSESLAPPLCLLGDDPTSPFETIQINVSATSDDPSGNNSLHHPRLYQDRVCVCVCVYNKGSGVRKRNTL